MVKNSQQGQMMIESYIVMMAVALIIFGLLFWAYTLMTVHWCDYWAYRTNICLATGNSRGSCQQELEKQIGIIVPRKYFKVRRVWKSPRNAYTLIKLNFETVLYDFQKNIVSEVALPLPSR